MRKGYGDVDDLAMKIESYTKRYVHILPILSLAENAQKASEISEKSYVAMGLGLLYQLGTTRGPPLFFWSSVSPRPYLVYFL